MMPLRMHVCNGIARPADESMLARDIGTTGRIVKTCIQNCSRISPTQTKKFGYKNLTRLSINCILSGAVF